ncbi:nucleoside hydrolase [Paenibacillus glycanilyticus]|uniref:nucleoside hydrolase n=1 Tax=Paenibacillus glycanilyticus TaxID=126569 RepID=UPI000FDA8AE5|nr:nucleoside hydrolase [Paenibacillus glycanilyticus]
MNYPILPDELRINRLEPPAGRVHAVLDTDTFNEIDDQFALVYALLSPERIQLDAIYAAPFWNELSDGPKDGMEKSYEEINRILNRLGCEEDNAVFRGSDSYLPGAAQPVDSPAARDLVRKALASPDDEPLYVIAIGAITNIASAILLEPSIIGKIVVVWLGGHQLSWRDTKEFNLAQDIHASRVIFDSGVPLVLVPCHGVASHLITTLPEIRHFVQDKGEIGAFLAERYEGCSSDHYGYSRVIWDLSAVAYLVNPALVPCDLVHSPVLTDQVTWSFDAGRHLIRCAHSVNRDGIFKDLFRKLEQAAGAVLQEAEA